MKIAFLAPLEIDVQRKQELTHIIDFLTSSDHTVTHALSVTANTLVTWTAEKRNEYFNTFYKKLGKCDIVIAECTFPSVHVGFEISNAIQQGKEIIMLKSKDALPDVLISDQLNLHKNIYIYEYTEETLFKILKEALVCNPIQKYKKYNVLFPTEMVNKLNIISKKKNLPKSVYIRQLVEKGLATESIE